MTAANEHVQAFVDHVKSEVGAMQGALGITSSIPMNNTFIVSSPRRSVALHWRPVFGNSLVYTTLDIEEFDVSASGSGTGRASRASQYVFDVNEADVRGWRETERERRFFTSEQLAEYWLQRILDAYKKR